MCVRERESVLTQVYIHICSFVIRKCILLMLIMILDILTDDQKDQSNQSLVLVTDILEVIKMRHLLICKLL